jgi:hypothetical protein
MDLDAFDAAARRRALLAMLRSRPHPEPPVHPPRVNLHLHSFFSYNARGWSPTHLAWESARQGFYASGLCDFDVLDGLEEFLEAGRLLGLRATVSLETRVFLADFGQAEINSPGEPGVTYIMACGFGHCPAGGSAPAAGLAAYRAQADRRNRELVARINARIEGLAVDYDRDVVPLSPGRCPTERHIVRAYREQGQARLGAGAAAFWARIAGKDETAIRALESDIPAFEELIRAKLAKQGGLSYIPPTPSTFPPAAAFTAWALACGAIPTITWLDGTSAGESDMGAMCDCLMTLGAAAINLIPDRNHNIRDPALRARKVANLGTVVRAARARHLPIIIGTEMNKDGQPFFDDLAAEPLRPYESDFVTGARILVGHTLLARYADFSYTGPAAAGEFGSDTARKNAVFAAVGGLPGLTAAQAKRLEDMGPAKALTALRDAAARGVWEGSG